MKPTTGVLFVVLALASLKGRIPSVGAPDLAQERTVKEAAESTLGSGIANIRECALDRVSADEVGVGLGVPHGLIYQRHDVSVRIWPATIQVEKASPFFWTELGSSRDRVRAK